MVELVQTEDLTGKRLFGYIRAKWKDRKNNIKKKNRNTVESISLCPLIENSGEKYVCQNDLKHR